MLLIAPPDQVLDALRERRLHKNGPVFTPEGLSRFAIRPHSTATEMRVLLSTERRSWVYEDTLLEVGRVGMLYDTTRHGGKSKILIVLHDARLIDQGAKLVVANVAATITDGRHVDFMLAPIQDLVDHARLSLCLTNDGKDWRSIDVTDLVHDFIMLDEYGSMAVRYGNRITLTTCEQLIGSLHRGLPAVQGDEGWKVEDQSIFVHFVPPDEVHSVVTVYSPQTHLTTCFARDGSSSDYEAGGFIVFTSRSALDGSFIGLSQSGHGFMSGPVSASEIQPAR